MCGWGYCRVHGWFSALLDPYGERRRACEHEADESSAKRQRLGDSVGGSSQPECAAVSDGDGSDSDGSERSERVMTDGIPYGTDSDASDGVGDDSDCVDYSSADSDA